MLAILHCPYRHRSNDLSTTSSYLWPMCLSELSVVLWLDSTQFSVFSIQISSLFRITARQLHSRNKEKLLCTNSKFIAFLTIQVLCQMNTVMVTYATNTPQLLYILQHDRWVKPNGKVFLHRFVSHFPNNRVDIIQNNESIGPSHVPDLSSYLWPLPIPLYSSSLRVLNHHLTQWTTETCFCR